MWNRKELKTRGKAAFKANYWPCVLVAFIMMAIVGGGLAATRNSAQSSAENQREELSASLAEATGNDTFTITEDGQWLVEIDGELVDVTETEEFQIIILPAIVIGVAAVLFVAWLFGTIADIFLINPIEVSCLYFFTTVNNLRKKPKPLPPKTCSFHVVLTDSRNWETGVKSLSC